MENENTRASMSGLTSIVVSVCIGIVFELLDLHACIVFGVFPFFFFFLKLFNRFFSFCLWKLLTNPKTDV